MYVTIIQYLCITIIALKEDIKLILASIVAAFPRILIDYFDLCIISCNYNIYNII